MPTGEIIKAQSANTRRIARRPFTWEEEVWVSWNGTGGSVLED
jgi:putrescine transport system ATP-binding protein